MIIEQTKSDLYFANYNSTAKVSVNQGGTSSGKTWSLLDLLFTLAIEEVGIIITVLGASVPNLKKGAFRDAMRIRNSNPVYKQNFAEPNMTDRFFVSKGGSIIEFLSAIDEEDAKSGKRDYLFVNEATGIPYNIYWQFALRTTKRIFIDYNPSSRFWVHEKVIEDPSVDSLLIISDHRRNHFLSDSQHAEIENISDPELWDVYARGKTGKITGLIYRNWNVVSKMPETYKARWIGLDFGFTNDPTAIVDMRLSNGELWIDELMYECGQTNPDISNFLKEQGITTEHIIADSAEPKSIYEIKIQGYRIDPAQKGKDSIANGIDILKRYKLNITGRSKNIIKEISAYKWTLDPVTGNSTNKPTDKLNHAMDAIRYVALNKLGEKPVFKGIKVKAIKYNK